ncbi:fibronectin type III domain-containing protein [Nonomuraea sp. B10E8]
MTVIARWIVSLVVVLSMLPLPRPALARAGSAEPAARQAAQQVVSAPGQYHATRARVLNNIAIAANATTTIKVAGAGAVPESGVSTAAVNFALKGASAAGGVIVFPSELTAAPAVTGARYRSGSWDDHLLMVKVGTDGRIKVKNTGSAAVTVYADIHGYFTSSAADDGASYVPLDTSRIISNKSVPAGSSVSFTAVGIGGIPATGVAFVAMTLIVKSTGSGKVIVHPSGSALPTGSNIDYRPPNFLSNLVIVAPGPDGKITVNNNGAAALTVYADVAGYFATPGAETVATVSTEVALTPARIANNVSIAAGAVHTIEPLGAGGVPLRGVSGVGVNLTARSTAGGLLRIYPTDQAAIPSGGSMAFQAGDYWANFVPVKLGSDGTFTIRNAGSAAVMLAVDTFSYFTPVRVPAAPTDVIATAAGSSASVTWNAPADTGTSPITAYTVAEVTTGRTDTVHSTTALFPGLANGRRYSFRVRATSDVGDSGWSAVSNVVSPQPLPVPERALVTDVDPGDGRVRLSWAPPPSGGAAVATYRITVQPGDRSVEVAGDLTTTVVEKLDNGTEYTFTLVAVNGNGAGESSLPARATPRPGQAPLPPIITRTVVGDGRLTLHWLPAGDGGAALTGYRLSADPDVPAVDLPADATTGTLTGLTNGTAYSVRLTASNAIGTGEASVAGRLTPTARQVPGPPSDLEAAAIADGQVEVTWSPPTGTSSGPISAYTVAADPGGVTSTQQECTGERERCSTVVTGLDPATEYTFTVTATGADGTGPASAPTAPIRPMLRTTGDVWQLSPAAAGSLTAAGDDGTLIFDNGPAEITELTPGRYVIIPATPAAPDGLIRKVVTVNASGDRVSLTTVPAALTDLLAEGDLAGEVALDGQDLAAASAGPAPSAQAADGEIPAGPPLHFPLHRSIGSGGRLDADLVLAPKLVYDLKIRAGSISGTVALHNRLSGPIRVSAAHQADRTWEFSLGKNTFNRMVKVGKLRLPIVVTHVLTATARVEADGALTLSGTADITSGVQVSIAGRNGAVSPVFSDRSAADPPVLNGSGSARVGLTGSEFVSLAGTIGVGVEANPYLAAHADVAANPWWQVRAGVLIRGCFSWFDTCTPAQASKDLYVTLASADGPFRGISVIPAHATVGRDQPIDFDTVTHNAADGPVRWEVVRGPGSIDADGVYVSPAGGQAVIRATRTDGGVDDPTAEAGVEVDPYVPDVPVDVRAAGGPLSANVSWQPPPDSLVGITGFAVVATPLAQDALPVTTFASPSERGTTVYGLAPGVPYAVQVHATGQNAVGPPSDAVTVTPAAGLNLDGDSRNLAVDAFGNPDSMRDSASYQSQISGDGRYAFFALRAGSNLMPSEAYLSGSDALYLVRKDIDTGEIKLVSRRPDGRTPAPVDPLRDYAVTWDGSRAAYITLPDGTPGPTMPPGWDDDIDLIVSDVVDGETWVAEDGTADVVPTIVAGISGDGDIALFERDRPEVNATGGQDLILAERDGTRYTVAQRIYEPGMESTSIAGADISADGETVVYAYANWLDEQGIWAGELKIFSTSTRKYKTLLRTGDAEPYDNLQWPRISPDGTTVTYMAQQIQNGPFTSFTKKVTAVENWGTPIAQGEAFQATTMTANGRYIGFTTRGGLGGVYDTVAGSVTRPTTGGSHSLTYDGTAGVRASSCLGQCTPGVWYQRYDVPGLRGNLHSCNTPDYGYIGQHERRTGMRVKLCSPIPEGTPAASGIKPPGWPAKNEKIPGTEEWRYARGHLLGKQLGGAGTDPRNLVTLFQLANRELMDPEEDKVRDTVEDGEDLYYYVAPVYTDDPPPETEHDLSKRMPDKIHLVASGDKGFFLDACVPNEEGGTVTYDDPCTA